MTDRHLRRTELPDCDTPTIHHGMTPRVADVRCGCGVSMADKGRRAEAR